MQYMHLKILLFIHFCYLKQSSFLSSFLILNFLLSVFWMKVTKVFTYCCIFRKYKQINYKLQEHETFLLFTNQNSQSACAKYRNLLGYFLCKTRAFIYWICTVLQNLSKCKLHIHTFGVTSFAHDIKPGLLPFLSLTRWFTAGNCSLTLCFMFLCHWLSYTHLLNL
jgi:hypothetical protein